MYFVASKILTALAQPTSAMILLLLWGCWVRWASFGRRGNRRIGLALILMLLAAFTPLANWVLLPLENRFQRPLLGDVGPLAGIIVLGGFLDPEITQGRDHAELMAGGDRLVEAAVLARRFPNLSIVITGGSANVLNEFVAESELAQRLLADLGTDGARVRIETKSRTTAENATMTRELLAPGQRQVPGKWVLLTSAMHMPRAVGTFRRAGFDVVPYPVDYRTAGSGDRWKFFQQPSRSLNELDNASKEWAGLLVYWLRGESDSLFPGP